MNRHYFKRSSYSTLSTVPLYLPYLRIYYLYCIVFRARLLCLLLAKCYDPRVYDVVSVSEKWLNNILYTASVSDPLIPLVITKYTILVLFLTIWASFFVYFFLFSASSSYCRGLRRASVIAGMARSLPPLHGPYDEVRRKNKIFFLKIFYALFIFCKIIFYFLFF